MDTRASEIIDKAEAMSLLCTKSSGHWSLIKTIFSIPLIITSSVMCILNSFEKDGESNMKIPNVCVNGVSVFLLALQNNLRTNEKTENFKNLSNSFLQLAHQLESYEPDAITRENINNIVEKYDSLQAQVEFSEIPTYIKKDVINLFKGRSIPVQLNGASGLGGQRNSGNRQAVQMSAAMV